MKRIVTFIIGVFLFLTANSANAQQIALSKDSLYFPTSFSYDTLFVYNTGSENLLIDSLFSVHEEYAYRVEIHANDSTIYYIIDGGHDPFWLVIEPDDSAVFIFAAPDLCSICKVTSTQEYFEDSLIFMSNSLSDDSLLLFSYGEGYPSALPQTKNRTPEDFILLPNYPNPFNAVTKIRYKLLTKSFVRVSIFNISGKKVATLVTGEQTAGTYSVKWNANGFASGIYFCRLQVNKHIVLSQKLVLLK